MFITPRASEPFLPGRKRHGKKNNNELSAEELKELKKLESEEGKSNLDE